MYPFPLILDRSSKSQRKDLEKEVHCLKEVGKHLNIVEYFGVAENVPGTSFYKIFEYLWDSISITSHESS